MVRLLILKKTPEGYNYIGDAFKSDRDVGIKKLILLNLNNLNVYNNFLINKIKLDVGALNSAFHAGEYKAIVEIDWVSNYC